MNNDPVFQLIQTIERLVSESMRTVALLSVSLKSIEDKGEITKECLDEITDNQKNILNILTQDETGLRAEIKKINKRLIKVDKIDVEKLKNKHKLRNSLILALCSLLSGVIISVVVSHLK